MKYNIKEHTAAKIGSINHVTNCDGVSGTKNKPRKQTGAIKN